MNRKTLRLAGLASVAALALIQVGPAQAATPVANAGAAALTIGVAGQGTDSGRVTSRHDGSNETISGDVNPPVKVLGNQDLLNLGVLAQEARTSLDGQGRGQAWACAGVAGDGGSVAQVGASTCITPGKPVGLELTDLDLNDAVLIDPESALGALSQPLQPVMDQLLAPLTAAISDALAPLGRTGLGGGLGAVQASCRAFPDAQPEGSATLVDSALTLDVAGQAVPLLNLPVNPEPNTDLLVNLDTVLDTVLTGVRDSLNQTLDGQLAALSPVLDPVQDQLVNTLVAEVAKQLKPLSDNVLKVVLNEQTRSTGRIDVTALRLELLPAAKQFIGGASLVDLKIGQVTCGPNGKVRTNAPNEPEDDDENEPEYPTVITSGETGTAAPADAAGDATAGWAVAALVLAGAGGAAWATRKSLVP